MRIGNLEINGKTVLAPMAGVTDWAYRTVCAELGAALTVTEMVSSRALVYQDKKSVGLLKKTPVGVCGAQIFGNDPEIMAQGAKLALGHSGCDFIDINMGCPMPKIVNNGDGSALMKNPQLAGQIVRAVVDAVDVPVTVKTRIGWDRGSINVVELAKIVEDNGAAAIAVHGRTRVQMYAGKADWDIIRDVKKAVSVPVIANGDVFSGSDAVHILKYTGADMAMIGRGSFGDPWLFARANAALAGLPEPELPPLPERMDTAFRQVCRCAELKGERVACVESRKQLAWYLKGVPHASYYKQQLVQIESLKQLELIVREIRLELR